MEKKLHIKTRDGKHTIFGTLNTPKRKTDKLVIFVHGLTGHQNEHIFYNAVPRFTKQGIATFRFNLYSWEKDARRLRNATILQHAKDLERVAEHFKKQYEHLGAVGHSFGGLTVLFSDTTLFDALVLWDPSWETASWIRKTKYVKELDAYILDWGVEHLLGKPMYTERTEERINPVQLAATIMQPLKVICAGKGVLKKGGRAYFRAAKGPKIYTVIEGADHTFDEEGTEEKLHRETLQWMKRHLR